MKVIRAFISQVLRCLINFLPSLRCSQPETIIKEDVLVVQVCWWEISASDAAGTCAAVHPSAFSVSVGAAGPPRQISPPRVVPEGGGLRKMQFYPGCVSPGKVFVRGCGCESVFLSRDVALGYLY